MNTQNWRRYDVIALNYFNLCLRDQSDPKKYGTCFCFNISSSYYCFYLFKVLARVGSNGRIRTALMATIWAGSFPTACTTTLPWYFCREHGDPSVPILLPTEDPFFLFRKNDKGQAVDGDVADRGVVQVGRVSTILCRLHELPRRVRSSWIVETMTINCILLLLLLESADLLNWVVLFQGDVSVFDTISTIARCCIKLHYRLRLLVS